MKKNLNYFKKSFISMMLVIACMLTYCLMLTSCGNSNDASTSGDDDYNKTITKEEAISIAKKSSKVQNEIANEKNLEFFYTPDWGSATAEKRGDGWLVVLKGTISGYTDEYKSDFEYDLKFTAKILMDSSGYIKDIYVTI